MPRTDCLTPEELTAFHLGDLPDPALEELAGHLEQCPQCEAAARALDGLSDPVLLAYRRSGQAGPLPSAAAPPVQVGEYEILGEVGRGGMGVVYRARHRKLHRSVALKMLLGGSFANHDERARFHTEAEAVARLHHPNIVQIYEIGEYEGDAGLPRPYFTLELVEGGNLAGRLGGRPQPSRQAAAWLETLARAAHYAHEHGIIHRDLKPSNVLLTADGQPKICDFGVAKLLAGSDLKTLSGMLVGTAEYMAPEQASGEGAVGPAADVYALGAILYTALAGRPPFQGSNVLDTLEQVRRQEPVPPRRLLPSIPRDLDTICLKCLDKQPGRRYPSALALAEDLGRFLADEPIQARRALPWERLARWIRHHKATAGALGTVTLSLVAAATLSTVAAVQKEAERLKARAAQGRAEAAQQLAERRRALALRNLYAAKTTLTGMALDEPGGMSQVAHLLGEWRGLPAEDDPRGWEWFYCQTLSCRNALVLRGHAADASAVAFSPDGRRLASAGFDRTLRIWDATTGQQLLGVAAPWGGMEVSWSPDGRRLASANWWDKTVGIWDPATGKELRTLVGHGEHVRSVAYSPDGRRLASGDEGGRVIVWDAATGKLLFALTGTAKAGASLAWSPDGRRLATSNFGHAIKIWDAVDGKERATLQGHASAVTCVRWSPDGRKLATAGWDQTVRIWDAAAGTVLRVIRVPLIEEYEGTLCWSPDSRLLAGGCHDLAIRIWDVESGAERFTLRGHTGSRISALSWGPDGTRLASGERGWNAAIRIWDLTARPEPLVLSAGGRDEQHMEVAWSPDGQQLASAHPDGTVKIWEAATGQRLGTLRGPAGKVTKLSWSPDGRMLASGRSDATVQLWDPRAGRLLASFSAEGRAIASLSWSPDGLWLAAGSLSTTVTLWDIRKGVRVPVAFRGWGAAWSPLGNRLAVGEQYRITIHDAATGAPVQSWPTSLDHFNWPCWSPRGDRIASLSDYAVDVRDAATGRAPFPPLGHTQPVTALAWSLDGRQLAIGTMDHGIHLWDAVGGNPILTLRAHGAPVVSVGWSPDGTRLAASSSDGTITIWDATRGYEMERAPALLPLLDARIATGGGDREALRLRAGVHARRGAWDQAAADADRLAQLAAPQAPAFFQAGWWLLEVAEPGAVPGDLQDPFRSDPGPAPAATPPAPRPHWYLAAEDPNGYVPLAKEEAYYLTRVYVSQAQEAVLRLEKESGMVTRLWLNGVPVPDSAPTRTMFSPGWNTLAVHMEAGTPSSQVLFHPRAGFYLRLDPLPELENASDKARSASAATPR